LYVNSSNQSVPNLSCIINSTKEKLINDPYDSGRNKPLPPQYCVFFNQNISTSGSNWNTNLVTTVASLFNGVSTVITLFNNSQIITGTTAPMGWIFNVAPTSTNYRTNCRLTASNKPS
jgi:hypothetical protein